MSNVALRIVDAIAQRLGAEATKHDGVHGADASAREHRNRQLGNQREVDRDAVAALHAERLHHVGELTDLTIQVEVGQRPAIARLTFPDDRRLVAPRSPDVTIDAVDARVEGAADEPFRMRRFPVEYLRPLGEPLQFVGKACPESLGIALGARVHAFIAHDGLRLKLGRRRERTVFLKEVCDFWRRCVLGHSVTEYNAGSEEQDPVSLTWAEAVAVGWGHRAQAARRSGRSSRPALHRASRRFRPRTAGGRS